MRVFMCVYDANLPLYIHTHTHIHQGEANRVGQLLQNLRREFVICKTGFRWDNVVQIADHWTVSKFPIGYMVHVVYATMWILFN